MKRHSELVPRKDYRIIILIMIIAISLSIVSFKYSEYSSAQIQEISVKDIQSNAEIQSYDLSNSLSGRLEDITSVLQIITSSRSVQEGNLTRALSIFDEAERSTSDLVDFYMWLDKEGKIVWISNINQTTYEQYRGLDLSYRLYFSEPKATHEPYYSSVVDSNDRVSRLYISYPIISNNNYGQGIDYAISSAATPGSFEGEFKGVAVAGLTTDVLGKYLEKQISPKLKGDVNIIDRAGIILYSRDDTFIGKNVFGIRFQSYLQSFGSDTAETMSNGFKLGLHGQSGSAEVLAGAFKNEKSAFVYYPILLHEKQFALLYILVPYTEAAETTGLVESQKNLSILLIAVIGASAVLATYVVVRWNKELERTISERTAQLRQANDQLLVNDKLQKEFINIAAHELRTPVQPIIGMSELLESELGKDREDVKVLARNARRLEKLTQNILDVSKIESGALALNKRKTDLDDILLPLVIDHRNTKYLGQPDVRIKYEPRRIILEADKERIQQVVSNLINNALKFTKEGDVTVKSELVNGFVKVQIKDTGMGIDPEMMPRLFQKFASKSEKGIGLGLFISKNIIEEHGGTIWAENNRDGRGATFSFTLPIEIGHTNSSLG